MLVEWAGQLRLHHEGGKLRDIPIPVVHLDNFRHFDWAEGGDGFGAVELGFADSFLVRAWRDGAATP